MEITPVSNHTDWDNLPSYNKSVGLFLMKALILAAGRGSRLKPLSDYIPKCLVPIAGQPLLGLWLDTLSTAGIDEVFINLHWQAEQVRDYLAQGSFKGKVQFVSEEKLLGTAGTLLKNRYLFESGEPVLVIHADNLSLFDLPQFLKAHASRPEEALITMMTFQTAHPRDCGIVELNTAQQVMAFHEKVESPPGNLANAAVYIMEPKVITELNQVAAQIDSNGNAELDISIHLLPHLLGRINTWENTQYHQDMGFWLNLLEAQQPGFESIQGKSLNQDNRAYSYHGLWQKPYKASKSNQKTISLGEHLALQLCEQHQYQFCNVKNVKSLKTSRNYSSEDRPRLYYCQKLSSRIDLDTIVFNQNDVLLVGKLRSAIDLPFIYQQCKGRVLILSRS